MFPHIEAFIHKIVSIYCVVICIVCFLAYVDHYDIILQYIWECILYIHGVYLFDSIQCVTHHQHRKANNITCSNIIWNGMFVCFFYFWKKKRYRVGGSYIIIVKQNCKIQTDVMLTILKLNYFSCSLLK